MRFIFIAVSVLAVSLLAACSSHQAYDTGQAWQRNQCERLPGKDDRDRCMSRAGADYEAYSRETRSTK